MLHIMEALEDQIQEELNDSEKYINCAIKHKPKDKELADLYYWLSQEEIGHADKLSKQISTEKENYIKMEGEVPEELEYLYSYLQRMHADKEKQIKLLWAIYKEN